MIDAVHEEGEIVGGEEDKGRDVTSGMGSMSLKCAAHDSMIDGWH
jgi:hypothetical protein